MIEAAVLVFFPALMIFAACSDMLTMQISNRVSIALVAGFFPMAYVLAMPAMDILSHLSCGAAILAITFALFCLGGFGGGDAKLAATTAIWLGWQNILDYAVVTAIYGGALAVALLMFRRVALPQALMRQAWIARLHKEKGGIPYGMALAVAGLIVYPQSQIWIRAIVA